MDYSTTKMKGGRHYRSKQDEEYTHRHNHRQYKTEVQDVDEGLTQYFEELANKALGLTKKYGLKDEFNMIKSELKKNRQIQQQSSEEDDNADPDLNDSDDGIDPHDNFQKKMMIHLQGQKTHSPYTHRPQYEKKLIIKKGQKAPHARLYEHALRRKESIEKLLKIRDAIALENRGVHQINPNSE